MVLDPYYCAPYRRPSFKIFKVMQIYVNIDSRGLFALTNKLESKSRNWFVSCDVRI